MRRLASLGASLAALLAASALTGTASGAAAPPGFFGMNANTSLGADDFKRMRGSGVGMYRLFVQWAQVQRGGTGPYDWSEVDELVTHATLNGVDLMVALYGTPPRLTKSFSEREAPLHSKAARHGWKEFVERAVERYGEGGKFWTVFELLNPGFRANPISFWQVWNEQNSPTYYKPAPLVKEYAKLLRMTNREVEQNDPGAEVVLGGMFGTPPRDDAIYSWRFLERLYRIEGMRSEFDIVALHPYSPNLFGIRAQMRLARNAIKEAGDAGTPVWITEIGWGTDRGGSKLNKGRKGQARMLSEAFRLFVRDNGKWKLRRVMWFSWRDNPDHGTPCSWCGSAGLLEADRDPKPSWERYKEFARAAG